MRNFLLNLRAQSFTLNKERLARTDSADFSTYLRFTTAWAIGRPAFRYMRPGAASRFRDRDLAD